MLGITGYFKAGFFPPKYVKELQTTWWDRVTSICFTEHLHSWDLENWLSPDFWRERFPLKEWDPAPGHAGAQQSLSSSLSTAYPRPSSSHSCITRSPWRGSLPYLMQIFQLETEQRLWWEGWWLILGAQTWCLLHSQESLSLYVAALHSYLSTAGYHAYIFILARD